MGNFLLSWSVVNIAQKNRVRWIICQKILILFLSLCHIHALISSRLLWKKKKNKPFNSKIQLWIFFTWNHLKLAEWFMKHLCVYYSLSNLKFGTFRLRKYLIICTQSFLARKDNVWKPVNRTRKHNLFTFHGCLSPYLFSACPARKEM